jgi:aryl-alcohol dehydrogenase-like predicted oxidoreductase
VTSDTGLPAHAAGTVDLAGTTVHRLGFGAMRLTGPGVWGEPADRAEAVAVLRRAVELGVDFIDTADSYGPHVSEQIIREALWPYPEHLVIATKAGLVRPRPGEWVPVGHPAYLRQQVETSLVRLGTERIDLIQLHRIDPNYPAEEQVGVLADLQREGKVAAIGLSEVGVADLEKAADTAAIVSVQNRYNLTSRGAQDVLDYATEHGIAFIPWDPIASGQLARPGGPLDALAQQTGATPSQLALAWLLRRSPVMLPIPGTSRVAHLEENLAAAGVALTDDQYDALTHAA